MRTHFLRFCSYTQGQENAGLRDESAEPLEVDRWIPCGEPPVFQQFGGTIDMLETCLFACPNARWQGHLWSDHSRSAAALRIRSLLARSPTTTSSGSTPISPALWMDSLLPRPSPWRRGLLHVSFPTSPIPVRSSTPIWCLLRQRCQTTLLSLSEEQAHNLVHFPWIGEEPISYSELLLYTMRHVQEHAAQLAPVSRPPRRPGRGARLGRASQELKRASRVRMCGV